MLTPEDLEALLTLLSPDREEAGAQYEQVRRRLVQMFARRLGPDADSLADEAIDRVALRLAQDPVIHIERPFGYFRGVARHVAQEMVRERERRHQAYDAFAGLSRRCAGAQEETDRCPGVWLSQYLAELPADQRRLILLYYGKGDRICGRRRLAQALGIERNALRIRAHRIRRELRACCSRCETVTSRSFRLRSRRGGPRTRAARR